MRVFESLIIYFIRPSTIVMNRRTLLFLCLGLFCELHAEQREGSVSPQYACEDGWQEIGTRCYKFSNKTETFQEAMKTCNKHMAVIDDNVTNSQLKGIISSDAWIALQGDRDSYYWLTPKIRDRLPYVNFDGRMPVLSRKECGYMKPDGFWSTSLCSTKMAAICSTPRNCAANRFGERCDQECHCLKQCNRETGECPFGCPVEWTGQHCNIRRRKPTAKFFCLQQTNGFMALFYVDRGDSYFNNLAAVDSNGVPSKTCTISKFSRIGNTFNLRIEYKENVLDPECEARRVAPDVYKWVFKVQEVYGTDSFLDVQFEFQCNFTQDTARVKAETPLVIDTPVDNPVVLQQTVVTTEMSVVDVTSGKPVSNVRLGQMIQVILDVPEGGNDSVTFSPRLCVARSRDKEAKLQLTDYRGCQRSNTGFLKLTRRKGGYSSAPFPAFRLPGHSSVEFVCDLVPCYPGGHTSCKTPCSRYKRFVEPGTEGLTDSVKTTIHVR